MESKPDKTPLIVIVGETASGKSALALKLADIFSGELVCADALTVRREVNIGTAKPTSEERRKVKHHLLDVAGPCDNFTAAVFKRLADRAIDEISSKGKLPILVGGTGLYIDGVIYNYSFLPPAASELRDRFNHMDIASLMELIKERNLSLDDIDIRNKRRLIRVLETNGNKPSRSSVRPNTLILGVLVDRKELRDRIAKRLDRMLELGLESEVRRLSEKYGWDCEALKSIGYKEWKQYFEGACGLEHVKSRIIKSTMDLAKRQRTWFKRNTHIRWISKPEEAVDQVTTFLNK